MNQAVAQRYPERQAELDDADDRRCGRRARVRPGARLRVRGHVGRRRGPVVSGVALLTRVASDPRWDEALVATREYGRRWFMTHVGAANAVIEEVG